MSINIRWGSYKTFEGPWYPGDVAFKLPERPSLNDQIMAVITATEGGRWNAINKYDRCICTVGLIQWCERRQFSVSDMIHDILRAGGSLGPLGAVMERGKLEFKATPKSKGRFFIDGKEVTTVEQQKRMFLLNSDGTKGSWDDESRRYSRMWVEGLAKLFATPQAVKAQREFTSARLKNWFALKESREWLQNAYAAGTPGAKAFICGYLSFAANNPTWANKALLAGLENVRSEPFSEDWLTDVFESLTWHPGVSIYPHRYNKIRPVLERQFGIDLPDFAQDLKMFSDRPELLLGTDDIQALLVKLGYDLGVSGHEENGVDDIWGSRTTAAFKDFEAKSKLPADGRPDPAANAALISAVEALG